MDARAWFSLVAALLLTANIRASPIFTFSNGTDGWINQTTEPFSVSFLANAGLESDGALAIAATAPRDSYQIVHTEHPEWPALPSFFEAIAVDVRLESGISIVPLGTGLQIRNSFGMESNVYLNTGYAELGGGWIRLTLTPTSLYELPGSHKQDGISLHFQITPFRQDTLVLLVDRIQAVPEPSIYALLMTGAGALWWARRRA
jgi:hypothetical protein